MTGGSDAVTVLAPLRPSEDFSGVPDPAFKQVLQQGANLGHAQLRLFFPPNAAVAVPGTILVFVQTPFPIARPSFHPDKHNTPELRNGHSCK